MDSNNTSPFLFQIERVISRRETEQGTEYFIKWKNYPEEENTWEPIVNLLADKAHAAVHAFEMQCTDTPPKDVALFLMQCNQTSSNTKDNNNDNDHCNDNENENENDNDKDEQIDSDEDINKMEEPWLMNYGSLPRDSINKIIKLEMDHSKKELYAQVEWNIRVGTNIKPPNSLVKSRELKKYCLRFYIDYLESLMYIQKK